MNQNRNVVWIAVIGVVIVILVGYLLTRPRTEMTGPVTPAATSTAPAGGMSNEPPLAPAVPVLPPEPNATPTTPGGTPAPGTTQGDAALPNATPAPPEIPAPPGPTPSQPAIPEGK